jgi:uncharacterized SAM-binding protein YcdF (DUF218 family)
MNIRYWWTVPDNPPSHPDCFVIPSYALKDSHRPNKPTIAQIQLAFRWWQRFAEASFIMSTGDNQGLGVSNARVMAEYAERLGVPRERILEEDRSRNTNENLLYSMDIVRAKHFSQVTLVTLDLYTRRAVATARKQGWRDFYWLSVYSPGEPAYGGKWLQTSTRGTIMCYEMVASLYSRLAGWM